jgi:hypothetical protein
MYSRTSDGYMYMLDVGIELRVMRTENADTGAPVYCRLMSSHSPD